jgi:glycosyltransferase involved in cell wall biosynthesis
MQATLLPVVSRDPTGSVPDALPVGSRLTKTPIRVSYLIDDLSRAGTESQLLALIRALDRTRFEPSLVLLNGEGELSRSLEPADCPVLRLGVTRLVGVRSVSAAKRLWSFWRATKPDIAQIYFNDSSYFGVPVAKLAGVRRVVRVRNNLGYWQTRKHRWLGRMVRPLVDAYLTNSELGRDAIRTTERVRAERVTVIENGVDLERYSRSGWVALAESDIGADSRRESATRKIGCVANLRAVKNIDGLMRAAKLVLNRFPDVVFEVAGEGEQRAALEALHRELGLGGRLVLRGVTVDVPAFLRSVDVAVLPSHSEGMSNAVLEYMAAGRAVVATDVGANARLIEHGVSGLIVPPKDEPALADAIGKVIEDPHLAARFGREARRRVERDHSREAMVARFEAFYRRLVQ